MFKQIFNNIFNRKEAKLGFKIFFINGTINHKPITNIVKDKCLLDFENQTMIIKQGDVSLTEKMSDVSSMRTWTFKGNVYFAVETKTNNEYKFSFGTVDFWLKAVENYAKEFDIPFEYCGESEESSEDDDNDE